MMLTLQFTVFNVVGVVLASFVCSFAAAAVVDCAVCCCC